MSATYSFVPLGLNARGPSFGAAYPSSCNEMVRSCAQRSLPSASLPLRTTAISPYHRQRNPGPMPSSTAASGAITKRPGLPFSSALNGNVREA